MSIRGVRDIRTLIGREYEGLRCLFSVVLYFNILDKLS